MSDCITCHGRGVVPLGGGVAYCPDCKGGTRPGAKPVGCLGMLVGFALIGAFAWVVISNTFFNEAPGVLSDAASVSTWSGDYTCPAGNQPIRMRLEVGEQRPGSRPAEGTFEYLGPDGKGVVATSSATGFLEGRRLRLLATDQAAGPANAVGGVTGMFDESTAETFLGQVSASECTALGLTQTSREEVPG